MRTLEGDTIAKILQETLPSFQLTDLETGNLGMGFLYYGLARVLRPRQAVVIGSKKGFSVICMARAMLDNAGYGIKHISCYKTEQASAELPALHFVDPSYSIDRSDDCHMYGVGFWDNPDQVCAWWNRFGVGSIVTHYKVKSVEFRALKACPDKIDLLLIDGDHHPEAIVADIERFAEVMDSSGIILAHDLHPDFPMGSSAAFDVLDSSRYEKTLLPFFPGLAIIRPIKKHLPRPTVDFT